MNTYETRAGQSITTAIKEAIRLSQLNNNPYSFSFNGLNVIVDAYSNPEQLLRDFHNAHHMKWDTIGPDSLIEYSEDIKSQIEESKAIRKARFDKEKADYEKSLAEKEARVAKEIGNHTITLLSPWDEWESKNKDPYGAACFTYAERWGCLMEVRMKGKSLHEVANKASHDADIEGVTGFMYGVAVSILSQHWVHGEELRKWHNKEYDHEGEGVVNPAVLSIGSK